MESFFTRYRNPMVLAAVLLAQILGLAVQVKRPLDPRHADTGSVRLIRVWAEEVITPCERLLSAVGRGSRAAWGDYVDLLGVRRENQQLRHENQDLRLQQAALAEEAAQARRLQALLDFKERFVGKTVAAQVVGSSGTEQSRVLYIDKGAHAGLQPDMAVITPQGVVGKLRDVSRDAAQVLLINDSSSGVGAILTRSRLYGVVKGTPAGGLQLDHVMSDEKVSPGEPLVTSGGDQIFPKGLPVGTVEKVSSGSDLFLNIQVRPAVDLDRLEEVLVITQAAPAPETASQAEPARTADILAERLPTLELKQPADSNLAPQKQTATAVAPGGASAPGRKPQAGTATAAPNRQPASAAGAAEHKAQPVSPLAPASKAGAPPPVPAAPGSGSGPQ